MPKTDTIADLLAKGALVACEPPEKTKEKADDNCFQFPWGLRCLGSTLGLTPARRAQALKKGGCWWLGRAQQEAAHQQVR